MLNFNHILFDFVESLYDTEDPELMFLALETAIKEIGYEHVSYTLIPGVVLSSETDYVPVFQLSEGYDGRLIEYHVNDSFLGKGLVSKYFPKALNIDMSVRPWWEGDENQGSDVNEERVVQVARYEHGISNGITIPTYSDGYNVASVSVYSTGRPDKFWSQYNKKIAFLKKVSIIYSDRIIGLSSARNLFYAPFLSQLTGTERSVLIEMSKGQSVQNIAYLLGRDYKYIANKILPGIRKKMGDVSRDRMMYFVGQMLINSEYEKTV